MTTSEGMGEGEGEEMIASMVSYQKRVVDEKERAERNIYIFLGLKIGMKCYK